MTPMTSPSDLVAQAPYGRVERLSPRIRRVLARNPSPFTYTGTGTYIIGSGDVAVIDPGPDDAEHIAALDAALAGEQLTHILITHNHRDHSPAAPFLAQAKSAKLIGCAALQLEDDGPRADAAFDMAYAPDQVLQDGETISGADWTLQAVATPGHTSNHLCFALQEEKALFTGDHVMGWSTSVVSPPDGDMAAYMASLKKLLQRDDLIYYPTHGEPVTDPQRLARGMLAHRKQREAQIIRLLSEEGPQTIPQMVRIMYAMVNKALHGAAGRSVLAHLIDMQARQIVRAIDHDQWQLVQEER